MTRLDQALVERGLCDSREKAKRAILANTVRVNQQPARKASDPVKPSDQVSLAVAEKYVSRGGHKLAAALDAFEIDPTGLTGLDVGASTGGFTDCLLQRGATRVYALDVGRGQLVESLRGDPRVVSMERTHAARLDPDASDRLRLPEPDSLADADVSFISQTRQLRGIKVGMTPDGDNLPMVKPQFELSPREVPRGVVRDAALRAVAVEKVADHARGLGLQVLGSVESPLVGPSGNHEFFLHLRMPGAA